MQTNLSTFMQPGSEREIYRSAFGSIISEYAKQHPSLPFDHDDPDLSTLVGHRVDFGGNYSQLISRLERRFQDTSFEAHTDSHLDLDDLNNILETDSASHPLIELDREYYQQVSSYRIQPGQFDFEIPALVIPIIIQEKVVYCYDPVIHLYAGQGAEATMDSVDRGLFLELWGRPDLTRWAFWIDQGRQRTLSDVMQAQT